MFRLAKADGFALISVLWSVALLALLAASIGTYSALNRLNAITAKKQLQMSLAAEAAVNTAIFRLLSQDDRPPLNGAPYTFSISGYQTLVSVQSELGKLDINYSSLRAIKALCLAAGLSQAQASKIVDSLAERRTWGRREYFYDLNELMALEGMSKPSYKAILPFITVHSRTSEIDPTVAPQVVLHAFAKLGNPNNASLGPASMQGPKGEKTGSLSGQAFTISVVVQSSGIRTQRNVVTRILGQPDTPYVILAWQ